MVFAVLNTGDHSESVSFNCYFYEYSSVSLCCNFMLKTLKLLVFFFVICIDLNGGKLSPLQCTAVDV